MRRIQSRHQEFAEREKISLYHLNRELKRGKNGSITRLSKTVNKEEVIVRDRDEIEKMTVSFFTSLFQGHHRSDGTIKNVPFSPDFTKLDDFLKGLGQLDDSDKNAMIKDISLAEVETAIKESSYNKSPGIDGLTYEFYKKNKDALAPILVEVINCQLKENKLCESNTIGLTRLVSKVPENEVPTLENLHPITLLTCDYKIMTKVLAKRMSKILPKVIRSSQSCGVKGTNICSSG